MDDEMMRVAERLSTARRVVALTGAGVSEESGIPTFRDPQTGLWKRYDPLTLATAEAFARDPKLVWDWYEWRRGLRRQAETQPSQAMFQPPRRPSLRMDYHYVGCALRLPGV